MRKRKSVKKYFIQTMGAAFISFLLFMIVERNVTCFEHKISDVVICISYFCVVFILMKMEIKYSRSWTSIITNTIFPLVIYSVFCMGFLNGKMIVFLLLCIFIFIFTEFFFSGETLKEKKEAVERYIRSKLKYEMIYVFLLSCIFVLVLLITSKENVTEEIIEMKEEYLLENHLYEASKIENWINLSGDEKENVLNTFIKIEASKYGMNTVPNFEITELQGNCIGRYSRADDTVYIDAELCEAGEDPYNILFVLCHEMTHRFQYIEIEFMKQIMEDSEYKKYHNSIIFNDSKIYAEEFDNYIAGDTEETYQEYSAQRVEIEADRNAQSSVEEYKTLIEEYLNESGEK